MYNVSKVSKTFGISKIFVAFILVLRYRIRSFVETIKNFTVMTHEYWLILMKFFFAIADFIATIAVSALLFMLLTKTISLL